MGGTETMGNADVVYRRMATGVVLLLSLTLGFEALNPHSEIAPATRVILLVVIVFIVVGILPGSYIQRRIQVASQTEAVRRSRLLRIVAVLTPFLGAAGPALVALSEYSTLSFVDNTYLSGLDRGEVMFNIIRFWTQSGTSLVWLVVIVAALTRGRSEDPRIS
jgi:Na+/proline symporter